MATLSPTAPTIEAVATPAPAPEANERRLDSLTGMRWIAAMLVFGYHVHLFKLYSGRMQGWIDWAFSPGLVGVSFFFILSGFVIGWSALRTDRPVRSATFWRRRVARIYPLHLVTALLALGVFAAKNPPQLTPPNAAFANVLLVSSWHKPWWQALNPVSWTLCCEAFFYACFPLLFVVVRRLGPALTWAVAGVSLGAIYLLPWLIDNGHVTGYDINTFPPMRLPEFVLGIALSRLVYLGAWRWSPLTTAAIVAVAGYFFTEHVDAPYVYAACTALGFSLLIVSLAVADLQGLRAGLRHPVMVKLGELSFAFYLVHLITYDYLESFLNLRSNTSDLGGLFSTVFFLLASLLGAWLLHRFVEVPGQRLITRRWRRRPEPAPV